MPWSAMRDMALTDEERIDAIMPVPMAEKPEYPCGLRITLCDPELEKLDIDEMPDIGDVIDIRAFAEVTSVSAGAGGRRVELQIKHIACEDESEEPTSGGDY